MSPIDARSVQADPQSTERIHAAGLDYRVVDVTDDVAADAFSRADARGFLDAEPSDTQLEQMRRIWQGRRNIGVFEADAEAHTLPIATVNSWVAPMTVPGGEIAMWAISSVTVAGTHRRRGIARNLMEGELRSAAASGVPIAGLTASEATIYSRYGFAPAIPVARVEIDTSRSGWIGAAVPGRVEYVERSAAARELGEVHERALRARTGQIPGWPQRWQRMLGLNDDGRSGAEMRAVRYADADGVTRGVLAYKLTEQPGTFRFSLSIVHLGAESDEALRALWGFAVNHDLVTKVSADLRPVDDPITWLVADQRAVTFTVHDHGWLRILDVPAALSARSYRAPVDVVLKVVDVLGFATGSWRLVVDQEGAASVTRAEEEAADVVLDVVELSALFAGGVSATRLRAAGRLTASAATAVALDDAFRTVEAPLLGIWY